ncbi:MAG: pilus assembly protein PilP [Candidatus Adiutrix sp.]|nr:pilus assembly protein PilP [Candidatus Adiutrix sp.]
MRMGLHICSRVNDGRLIPALVLAMLLISSSGLSAQEAAAPGQASPEIKFEVLEVTTGSGSKSQPAQNSEIKIEVLDEQSAAQEPGAAPGQAAGGPQAGSPASPGPNGKEEPAGSQPEEKKSIIESLDQWRYETLASYNYNVLALPDPFLPIKEVRGTPDMEDRGLSLDPDEEAKLPPLLRLELNQLKLVAITVLSGGRGAALASFEDGAGNSYIMRGGERIGRRQGRITKITADTVTVAEPSGIAGNPPRMTDIRLNVGSSEGLTRSGGPAEDQAGAP